MQKKCVHEQHKATLFEKIQLLSVLLIEHLSSMYETLGLTPNIIKIKYQ